MAFTKIEKKIIAAAPADQQPAVRKAIMAKRKLLRDGTAPVKVATVKVTKRSEKKVVDTSHSTLLESYDQVRASWVRKW